MRDTTGQALAYVYFERGAGTARGGQAPAAVAVCGDERRLLHRARQERPGLIHEPYSGLGA